MKLTPKEARAAWVKALRSGEYTQGEGHLRISGNGNANMTDKHCCLGVACDVFQKIEGKGQWKNEGFEAATYDYSVCYLPAGVTDWLGLASHSGATTKTQNSFSTAFSLIGMNDEDHATFDDIAKVIEDNGIMLKEDAS